MLFVSYQIHSDLSHRSTGFFLLPISLAFLFSEIQLPVSVVKETVLLFNWQINSSEELITPRYEKHTISSHHQLKQYNRNWVWLLQISLFPPAI